jgi:hypothetical protein
VVAPTVLLLALLHAVLRCWSWACASKEFGVRHACVYALALCVSEEALQHTLAAQHLHSSTAQHHHPGSASSSTGHFMALHWC